MNHQRPPRGRHRAPTNRTRTRLVHNLLTGGFIAPLICALVAIGPLMPTTGTLW